MGGVILTTSRHCLDIVIYVDTSRRGFVSIDPDTKLTPWLKCGFGKSQVRKMEQVFGL